MVRTSCSVYKQSATEEAKNKFRIAILGRAHKALIPIAADSAPREFPSAPLTSNRWPPVLKSGMRSCPRARPP